MYLPNFRFGFVVFAVLMLVQSATTWSGSSTIADEPKKFDPNTLYGSERVTKIEITLEPESWDRLRLQKRDFVDSMLDPSSTNFDNFRGKIRIDGFEIPDVAIRKKGFFGSVDDDFPSLKIKFDEYVDQAPMGSVKRLTLNNNKQDLPLLSQFMAYRFFNQVGVPAPRVGFATLYVNDKHLGVYSIVESVDKPFLAANYGNNAGDLLEGTLADFSKKSLKRLDFKSGAHKSSEEWRVNQVAELLEEEKLDLKKLEQLIDMESFYRFWVTESLLACWDGYSANQNNYFVYDNPKTGRLHFIPWAADSLWSSMSGPFGGFSKPIESVFANSLLAHRIFKTEAGSEHYRETLREILEKDWNEAELSTKVDELAKLVEPHLHARQKGAERAQKEMKRFIQFRRGRIEREFEKWPIAIPAEPRRPTHSDEVGSASGEFASYWQRLPTGKESSAKIKLVIDDAPIEFTDLKVISKRFSMGWMSFGTPPESLPPIVEITGKSSNGSGYVLSLSFDNSDFVNLANREKKRIRIRGSLTKLDPGAAGPPLGGPNMRWLQGTCELSEASTSPESPVVGQFDVKIYRLVGGFFGG